MLFTTLSVAALAAVANAVLIPIAVGLDGNLAFDQANITANIGDVIQWIYYPMNHSVIQSTFAAPCTPMQNGFYSGFMDTAGNASAENPTTFEVTINATSPIWYYCGQTVGVFHCNAGMFGAINANASSFATFAAAATTANVGEPTVAPEGGSFVALSSSTNSSGNSTNSTSSTSSNSTASPSSTSAASPMAAVMGAFGTVVLVAAGAVVFAL